MIFENEESVYLPYETALLQLLRDQYGREEFFAALHNNEKSFLSSLIKKYADLREPNESGEFVSIERPEDLALITLDDPASANAWYCMLKGKKNRYPSLLDFISWDRQKTNFLFIFYLHLQRL